MNVNKMFLLLLLCLYSGMLFTADLKLFAVYLGGRAAGCMIETHDVVFVVGHSLEETYPQLIKKWFGIPEQLHIDHILSWTM
jgi:hypothetical protein